MSTQTTSPPPEQATTGRSTTNWLVVVLVGVLAAIIGFGAGYLIRQPEPRADVDPQVQALLDDFWAAAEAADADAVIDLLSWGNSGFFGNPAGDGTETIIRTNVERWANVDGPYPIGEPMVTGEYGTYDIAQLGMYNGVESLFIFFFIDDGLKTDGMRIAGVDIASTLRN